MTPEEFDKVINKLESMLRDREMEAFRTVNFDFKSREDHLTVVNLANAYYYRRTRQPDLALECAKQAWLKTMPHSQKWWGEFATWVVREKAKNRKPGTEPKEEPESDPLPQPEVEAESKGFDYKEWRKPIAVAASLLVLLGTYMAHRNGKIWQPFLVSSMAVYVILTEENERILMRKFIMLVLFMLALAFISEGMGWQSQ
jgi:hypothetical protein